MLQIICVLTIIISLTIFTPLIKNMERYKVSRLILWVMFTVYIAGNLYFTVFSRSPGVIQRYEFYPLKIYSRLLEIPQDNVVAAGFVAKFLYGTLPIVGLILNILLYYPLGYLLPILFPKLKSKHVILIGCLCSIATEATQYLLKMGWCETDDVIHNTLGTAIGVWVWLRQSRSMRNRQTPKEEHNTP